MVRATPCKFADGREFASLADATRAYNSDMKRAGHPELCISVAAIRFRKLGNNPPFGDVPLTKDVKKKERTRKGFLCKYHNNIKPHIGEYLYMMDKKSGGGIFRCLIGENGRPRMCFVKSFDSYVEANKYFREILQ